MRAFTAITVFSGLLLVSAAPIEHSALVGRTVAKRAAPCSTIQTHCQAASTDPTTVQKCIKDLTAACPSQSAPPGKRADASFPFGNAAIAASKRQGGDDDGDGSGVPDPTTFLASLGLPPSTPSVPSAAGKRADDSLIKRQGDDGDGSSGAPDLTVVLASLGIPPSTPPVPSAAGKRADDSLIKREDDDDDDDDDDSDDDKDKPDTDDEKDKLDTDDDDKVPKHKGDADKVPKHKDAAEKVPKHKHVADKGDGDDDDDDAGGDGDDDDDDKKGGLPVLKGGLPDLGEGFPGLGEGFPGLGGDD